ncbi:DNA-binding storekeeper protein-related transcriptional regulator [Artemisia annua]|uniref:DNA-binding storekeeper protein-related transcriptional regulator n=1 Tax=Artemisia annua TaxID=35608 RepID=A0A2U1KU39_ARTAN|nr:DNA-binding storekeeper protein-related transcriptional regulator [Artemisia annua]
MAKNRQPDTLPPPPSSDEEEDDTGSEEEQSSGPESDEDSPPNPKQPRKTQSDDSESDGSDDDSQANIPTVIIKPISSKPMKNDNQSNPDAKTAKKDDPNKKRKNSEEPEKEAKKAKKTDEEDSKKPLFQRLFSEEDELVILKNMIDYKNENGITGEITDMSGFYEIVRKLLRVDFSRAQLVDKVRRLKKKFNNNAVRELKKKNRKGISFSRSNEREGYELSKLLWGSGASSSIPPNGVDDNEVLMMDVDNSTDVNRFVKYGGSNNGPVLVEEIVKAGMELVDDSKRAEWEAKWKILKLQELELYAKRTNLVQEHVAVVIEGVKSSAI